MIKRVIEALFSLPLILAMSACNGDKEPQPDVLLTAPQTASDISTIVVDASGSKSLSSLDNTLEFSWDFNAQLVSEVVHENESRLALTLSDVKGDTLLEITVTVKDIEAKTSSSKTVIVHVMNERAIIVSEAPTLSQADIEIVDSEGLITAVSTTSDDGKAIVEIAKFNKSERHTLILSGGYYDSEEGAIDNNRILSFEIKSSDIVSSSVAMSLPTIAVDASVEGILETISFSESLLVKDKNASILLAESPTNEMTPYENLHLISGVRPPFSSELGYLEQEVEYGSILYPDFYSVYLSLASEEEAEDILMTYFARFFDFNNRNIQEISSTYIRIGLIGKGKVYDGDTIEVDTASPDFTTVSTFLIEDAQQDYVTLTADPYSNYEFDFWVGCQILTADDKCRVPAGEKSYVKAYFKAPPPTYNSNIVDLSYHDLTFDGDRLIVSLINGEEEKATEVEGILGGDYIVGNQNGGFASEVIGVELIAPEENKYVFVVRKITLAEMIESGGMSFNRQITNLDIFNTTSEASQGLPYNPGTFVVLEGSTGIILGEDPNSDELVFANADIDDLEDGAGSGSNIRMETINLSGGPLFLEVTNVIRVSSYGNLDVSLTGVESASFGYDFEITKVGSMGVSFLLEGAETDLRRVKMKRLATKRVGIPFYTIPIGTFVWVTPKLIFSAYNDAKYARLNLSASAEGVLISKMGFDVLYTRDGGADGNAYGSLDTQRARFNFKTQIEVEAGLGAGLGMTINSVEIPATIGVNLKTNFKALTESYTGITPHCEGMVNASIIGTASFGVSTTYEDGLDVGFWTIPIKSSDVRYDIAKKVVRLYESGFFAEGDYPECYTPSFEYDGGVSDKTLQGDDYGWVEITQGDTELPSVFNSSQATGHYKVKISDDSLWRIKRFELIDGERSGEAVLANNSSYMLDNQVEHHFSIEFNVGRYRSLYTSGDATLKFEIVPDKIPLFGLGGKVYGNTFTAKVGVSPVNPPPVDNVSISSKTSSYPELRWTYDVLTEKAYRHANLEFRVYLNDEYQKTVPYYSRSTNVSIDKYGNNTFSIIPATRFGDGEETSRNFEITHPYTGSYSGIYSWNCGLFSDDNGDFYINEGSASMMLNVFVDAPRSAPRYSSYISGIASYSGVFFQTNPLFFYGGSELDFKGRINSSVVSVQSYNGPNCSHPTVYWGASRAALYKQ